ncbi:MAG: hypothetical protein LAO09_23065 [Acidobacteriia bacterium]|nr:hypothetical protein [Terriglobia bacterium]
MAITASAQTLTTIANFNSADGDVPKASLVQGIDGNYYGTTFQGGANYSQYCFGLGCGTVFQVTSAGTLTTIYSFCVEYRCSDGANPSTAMSLVNDGSLYGTTPGTIFQVNPDGTLTTFLHLCCTTYGGVIQGVDRNFYGTTSDGGNRDCNDGYGCGTVYKVTPTGVVTTLHAFDGTDGSFPHAGLTQAHDGDFYGTTFEGTENCRVSGGCGSVFRISPTDDFTVLHSFDCDNDGANPEGTLIESADGNLYGTTAFGCGKAGGGTVFRITPAGVFTTLYRFCSIVNCPDGLQPDAGVIQATDGNFYGTTTHGGDPSCQYYGCGTLFKLTPAGVLTTLHAFCPQQNCPDGDFPFGGLIQATDGKLYGTTADGGIYNAGTIFAVDLALDPFVSLIRDSGKVSGIGGILGQGFAGTTSVSLNGTPAKFKVISDTFIRAQVPNGATTGFVSVTTPSGTLTSNKVFRVRPQLLSFDPPSGPVGTQVTITGVSLTQTQGVGFGNRVPAQFTVNSDTQVTATVPSGAKTGKVGIQTKGGTAISSGTFTVTQ